MSSTIENGFSVHRERFAEQWAHVWALDERQRGALPSYVERLRVAKTTHEPRQQVAVFDELENEHGPSGGRLTEALGVLDYLGHLAARSHADPEEIVADLEALGFLPKDDTGAAREFLITFLADQPRQSAS